MGVQTSKLFSSTPLLSHEGDMICSCWKKFVV